MSDLNIKKSIFAKIRNNFIAGIVVLIPIGIPKNRDLGCRLCHERE